ncbi:hypothetical protein OZX72_01675 [Bifidobacterium sp. ESL0769]|uniref:hypothetical protein n=1 Tax=Bifidobacterium sp. ESL0769 TaxID=2983229 RepID=UPI0023F9A191|nr:hypothetical protein [Bifidobacterium sp. ESL0769]WEV67734.1 hypothetical protein OZX72_01675 [Bifidobacterium sp. ESL0769]
MKIKFNYRMGLFLAFMSLVFSDSMFLKDRNLDGIVFYASLMLLCLLIGFCFIKSRRSAAKWNTVLFGLVTSIFLLIGIAVQHLPLLIKGRLIFSMVVIVLLVTAGKDLLKNLDDVRLVSYSILAGCGLSILVALITKSPMAESRVEAFGGKVISTGPLGFTGGLQYKNFFAADLLASFIGLVIYQKYRHRKSNRVDIFWIAVIVVLEILAYSKTCILLIPIFCVLLFGLPSLKSKGKYGVLGVGFFSLAGVVFIFSLYLIVRSDNYGYRVRGLTNYLSYFSHDSFRLWFGNAEMAFGNPELGYVKTVRSVVGWNGTMELALLDVLIKNGILGIIGYCLILLHWIIVLVRETFPMRLPMLSVLCIFILSACVESYVVNMHVAFGVFCYLLLAAFSKGKEFDVRSSTDLPYVPKDTI